MATLMRCMTDLRTLLGPALTIRISNRYVRKSRKQLVSAEVQETDLKSEGKEVKVKGKDDYKHVSPAPVLESTYKSEEKFLGSHQQQPTRKESSHVFISNSDCFNQIDGLRYDKARTDDKRLSRLVHLARSKKVREQQGKILLEGRRLISDALEAGASPQTIFFSTAKRLQELPFDKLKHASLVQVKMDAIQIWPDLDAPVDMIAIFNRPEPHQMQFSEEKYGKPLPLTLICDNLRDPGNLGATLRCAAAAGCHSVLLSTGCVDVWEPKVLRAAIGSHFRLLMIPNLTWSDIQTHLPATTTVHVADNCKSTRTEPELAAAPRQQLKARDHGWVSSRHGARGRLSDGEEFSDEEDLKKSRFKQIGNVLDTQPYHMKWTSGHTAVVIGGETHGLSQEALRLAERTGGRRLLVPMVQGVDSVNSAMAAGVLLFEGRRQVLYSDKTERTQLSHVSS